MESWSAHRVLLVTANASREIRTARSLLRRTSDDNQYRPDLLRQVQSEDG